MQNLLAFLVHHFHWLVFILLETVSVVMLFSYNSYQGSVWLSSANAVTGQVYEWQSELTQFFSLSRRSEELSQRNLFLEQEVGRLRRLLAQETKDSTERERQTAKQLSAFQLIPAKVVANSVDSHDNLITINRGTADGVKADMGVASGTGLVGVVYLAGKHYSVIIPILNKQSRISCAIRGHEYFGYLSWSGGSPVEAYLEDVPRHAIFRKGDWVETSGYSSIFPPGISVGRIMAIYNSTDGLSYRLKIHLSTDFACLRDVYVINDKGIREQRLLMEAAQDSLSLYK
ncbi:MAG: rod shape-determining protein MreC [Prevotella sp.]|nr:rod shape-determining protein MreC [Prevotella sp.]